MEPRRSERAARLLPEAKKSLSIFAAEAASRVVTDRHARNRDWKAFKNHIPVRERVGGDLNPGDHRGPVPNPQDAQVVAPRTWQPQHIVACGVLMVLADPSPFAPIAVITIPTAGVTLSVWGRVAISLARTSRDR